MDGLFDWTTRYDLEQGYLEESMIRLLEKRLDRFEKRLDHIEKRLDRIGERFERQDVRMGERFVALRREVDANGNLIARLVGLHEVHPEISPTVASE